MNVKRYLTGFTFIEIVVVIAVIGIVLPALFTIIFTIVRMQTKLYSLTEVKRQGDNIVATIKNFLPSNATAIYSNQAMTVKECDTVTNPHNSPDGNNFYIKDKNGKWFKYYITNNSVNFISDGTTLVPLTSTKVNITPYGGNFITCNLSSSASTPIVQIKFNVVYKTTSTRPEDKASMTYQTNIKLKSY